MAIIECAECGKLISDKAAACPHCGAPVTYPQAKGHTTEPTPKPLPIKESSGGMWRWILGIPAVGFVLVMVVGSCAGNSPEGQARLSDRRAIEYCWQEQARKSLDPATARFAAGACEKMESDFRQRHGRNP